jgi:hypothetical protein
MGRQIALFSAGLGVIARCAIFIACVALVAMTLVEALTVAYVPALSLWLPGVLRAAG